MYLSEKGLFASANEISVHAISTNPADFSLLKKFLNISILYALLYFLSPVNIFVNHYFVGIRSFFQEQDFIFITYILEYG